MEGPKFNCPDAAHQAFVCIDYHFAWRHGDATEDIGRTWLGMAGPGVNERELTELGTIYKQINAPFGQRSFDVLAASTRALASGSSADDSTYAAISDRIASLTARRDALAGEIRDVLNQAAFGDQGVSSSEIENLTFEAKTLLMQAHQLGAAGSP